MRQPASDPGRWSRYIKRVLSSMAVLGLILVLLFGIARSLSFLEELSFREGGFQPPPSTELPDSRQPNIELSPRWPEGIRQWKPLIEKYSERYKIDPNLVAAMALVESGGNTNAVSRSGACGILQVMARDTARVRSYLFRDRPTCLELQNPEFNILWGIHYLAVLYHQFGDSWREALFHYGPYDVGYSYADRVLTLWASVR